MTHSKIVAVIESHGGRLVASFVLDEYGRTVGAGRAGRVPGERREHNRPARCTGCGVVGHIISRCNGPGMPPRPTERERRIVDADYRQIIKERAKARTAARLKR